MKHHLLTFRQFAEKYPAFPEGSLRWLRFKSQYNGFGRAFVGVGRRVLVDVDEFFAVIERQNARSAAGANRAN